MVSSPHRIKFPAMLHSFFSQKLALEESHSTLPNVTYNFQDLQTTIFVSLIGLMLFLFFYQILDRFHNWLRNPTFEQDIEEASAHYNQWLFEIMNGFMAFLTDRRGLSLEEIEKVLPLVNYKSLGKTSDECVICLEDFEDDVLCRVFPVCKHVFHYSCIDNWLRNHITCPTCRNCIVDV
ncbi:hypothetical protein DITRI_Ditri14bG0116000 [Diplodiscus trichospermus]